MRVGQRRHDGVQPSQAISGLQQANAAALDALCNRLVSRHACVQWEAM